MLGLTMKLYCETVSYTDGSEFIFKVPYTDLCEFMADLLNQEGKKWIVSTKTIHSVCRPVKNDQIGSEVCA